MQHMILSPKAAGPLQRGQISWLLHYANERGIAPWIGANVTQFVLGQLAALPALADAVLDRSERIRQGVDLSPRGSQQMMRKPFRRLRPDAGQFAQLVHKAGDRSSRLAFHNSCPLPLLR